MQWRKWIAFKGKGGVPPGPISNKPIAERIMNYRMGQKYCVHDNGIHLREPEDVYVLS